MRISDWSSDVCSSDLEREAYPAQGAGAGILAQSEITRHRIVPVDRPGVDLLALPEHADTVRRQVAGVTADQRQRLVADDVVWNRPGRRELQVDDLVAEDRRLPVRLAGHDRHPEPLLATIERDEFSRRNVHDEIGREHV